MPWQRIERIEVSSTGAYQYLDMTMNELGRQISQPSSGKKCHIGMPEFTELYLFSHFYLSKYMFDQDWIINLRALIHSIQRPSQSRA
jgi:hypothetical protein